MWDVQFASFVWSARLCSLTVFPGVSTLCQFPIAYILSASHSVLFSPFVEVVSVCLSVPALLSFCIFLFLFSTLKLWFLYLSFPPTRNTAVHFILVSVRPSCPVSSLSKRDHITAVLTSLQLVLQSLSSFSCLSTKPFMVWLLSTSLATYSPVQLPGPSDQLSRCFWLFSPLYLKSKRPAFLWLSLTCGRAFPS